MSSMSLAETYLSSVGFKLKTAKEELEQKAAKEEVQTVVDLFRKHTKPDPWYHNFNINLRTVDKFPAVAEESVKEALIILENECIKSNIHAMTIATTFKLDALFQTLRREGGYKMHHANEEDDDVLFKKCLKNHTVKECPYPQYTTTSVGITAVVFNKDGSQFLVVKERNRLKPPTGTADRGELPIDCAVREVFEETNVKVKSGNGYFIGEYEDQQIRKLDDNKQITVLNINHIFAFITDPESQELIPQVSEVDSVGWTSTDEYIKDLVKLEETEKKAKAEKEDPKLLMPSVVRAAHNAFNAKFQQGTAWGAHSCKFSWEKPVTLYSA